MTDSPRWLFLTGLCRDGRHGELFAPALEAAMPGCKAYCLDAPGTGRHAERASPWSVSGIVDDLRPRWLALAAESGGPWRIGGISLGGMLVMDWVTRFPEDFGAAVVIVSSAGNVNAPHRRLRLGVLPTVLTTPLVRDPIARERRVVAIISNRPDRHEEAAQTYGEFQRTQPLHRRTPLRQLVAGLRFRAPARLPVPALFLGSHGDRFVHPSCSEQLARRFDAPLVMHPDGGHELIHDEPHWCAERIAEWLSCDTHTAAVSPPPRD